MNSLIENGATLYLDLSANNDHIKKWSLEKVPNSIDERLIRREAIKNNIYISLHWVPEIIKYFTKKLSKICNIQNTSEE